jgi:hypothetical protein
MRVLIIDAQVKEAASKVVEFATNPENLYRPGPNAKIPGDVKEHILQLGDYKVVFSLTKDPLTGEVYRHFSMSVPDQGSLPHPIAVNEVLDLFGFIGGLDNCQVNVSQVENCIVVAQALAS